MHQLTVVSTIENIISVLPLNLCRSHARSSHWARNAVAIIQLLLMQIDATW
jgi:hypothetical protein